MLTSRCSIRRASGLSMSNSLGPKAAILPLMDGHSRERPWRQLWEAGCMSNKQFFLISAIFLLVLLIPLSMHAQSADANVSRLIAGAPFKAAQEFLNNDYDR